MVKILGAGFGRTGTASLKAALEELGFGPCYHMFEVITSTERVKHWEKIVLDEENPDWDAVFAGFASTVDGPSTPYYRQIAEHYPDVKVILTVRDPERWYKSTYDTLYQLAVRGGTAPPDAPAEVADRMARFQRVVTAMTWDGMFGGRFSEKDHAIRVYQEHNEEVRRVIPAHRLLDFDVRQGWGPLCEFLGVEAPDREFPRVNDTESMPRLFQEIINEG